MHDLDSSTTEGLAALISVHDVMPETRQHVERILQRLEAIPPAAIALLIVPGRAWTPDDLDWLHTLAAKGYTLIGHGWRHECDRPRTLRHRLHSWTISNRAAEHLSLSEDGIARLMGDCHAWFRDVGLTPTEVYIPPAWALGPIRRETLASTPFRYVETLRGLYDTRTGRWQRLPVVGFEADRAWRATVMRLVNRFNLWSACRHQSALRIAIHPYDWQYPLAAQLETLLAQVTHHHRYPSAPQPPS
jgi:predicted deacetylase